MNGPLSPRPQNPKASSQHIASQLKPSYSSATSTSAGAKSVRDHMCAAGRRSGAWIEEAVRGKDRLEKGYFDYRVSVEALVRLLASYPSARKKLSVQLAAPLLADDVVDDARRRTLAGAKRLAAEVEQVRQLAAVH